MNRSLESKSWVRAVLAGAAGGVAWLVGIAVFFWPVQGILTDPDRQSPKLLAAFGEPPLPRMSDLPWLLPVGLLAWLVAIPWFELYLPFNVMREPAALVALELLCWFLVLQLVGGTIAFVYHGRRAEARQRPS